MTDGSKRGRHIARKLAGQKKGKAPSLPPVVPAPAPSSAQPLERTRTAISIDDTERAMLCIETDCSLRTIERFASGAHVSRTTMRRLTRALAKLGIQPRERASDAPSTRRRVVDVQRVA